MAVTCRCGRQSFPPCLHSDAMGRCSAQPLSADGTPLYHAIALYTIRHNIVDVAMPLREKKPTEVYNPIYFPLVYLFENKKYRKIKKYIADCHTWKHEKYR